MVKVIELPTAKPQLVEMSDGTKYMGANPVYTSMPVDMRDDPFGPRHFVKTQKGSPYRKQA
jgi:hypothetical protein